MLSRSAVSRCGIAPTGPSAAPRNKDRKVVERRVGWLEACRRILTRIEDLAAIYLAMIKVAMIERLFRTRLSDRA